MNDKIAIKVDNVSKIFKLPHEKNNSIKGSILNFYKRKRTFEKQQVLKNVSFEVKKGEFFGIVGRNGSGKSTLLKILAGIYSPSKGSVQVNGKLTPFIELGVGFNPELTGRENVFLNGALLGFSRKEMQKMYDEIVEFAELEKFMDQRLKNYSSGMQVRLAFSIAIRAKGQILLLDEVLAVGDVAFQKKCFEYFYELKTKGITVCFVSHDMSSVERFCDRALFVEKGELITIGKPGFVSEIYKERNQSAEHQELLRSQQMIASSKDASLKATVGDKNGAVHKIKSNEQIIMNVSVTAKNEINKAIISFTIEDENSTTIVGANTATLDLAEINIKKGETENFQFNIENIFGEGSYVIDIEVSTRSRSYIYVHQDEILKFNVTDYGEHPWLLRPKINVEKKADA